MTGTVLLVDDDSALREALSQTLDLAGYEVLAAGSFVAAKDHIARGFGGVILSDIRMPGRDGFHLLTHVQEVDADLPVILLTGEGDVPMAVRAMEQGAFDFLEKPCATRDLLEVIDRAQTRRRAELERREMAAQREQGDPAARLLFGVSTLAEGLRDRVRRAAQMQTEVLVTGAPGSGVSKVAEVIHLCSAQAQGPFQKRAAADLDRGALAGAIEAARGGALFIDEITRLPADTQIALLSHLEQRPQTRLIAGSTATAEQLSLLNEDLYYRLQVLNIRIPSIAERPEDIPVLFHHYVAQAAEQGGLPAPEVTPEKIAELMAQSWPGNARSLMSAAMRFVLGMAEDRAQSAELGLAEQMARVEKSLLIAALKRQAGHATEAAKALKLPRKTFYDKLARYGIRPEDYRG